MRTSWVLPDFRFSAMTSDLERFTLSDRRFNDLKNDSCTLSTAPRLGGGPISVFGSAVGAAVVTHFEAALNIVTVFFSTSYGDGRDKRHDKSLFNDKRKRRKKKKTPNDDGSVIRERSPRNTVGFDDGETRLTVRRERGEVRE